MSTKKYQAAFTAPKPIIKDLSLINHEAIRQQLTILPQLQELIPPQTDEEARQLEDNLLKHGCREALLVWSTTRGQLGQEPAEEPVHVLIDGHNRYRLCSAKNIDFKVHLVAFESLEAAKEFMIDNQLGRRNLTPENTSYLRGLRYLQEKGERGKYDRLGHKGQNVPYAQNDAETPQKDHKGQNVPYGSTAQKIASHYNVNEKTIKRDADYAAGIEKLDNDLRIRILNNQEKVKKEAIQALGKLDIPQKSVSSATQIDELIYIETATKRVGEPAGKKEQQLEQKIKKLAEGTLSKSNLEKLQVAIAELLSLKS